MFNAQAMILAAGRGERMRPLTDNTPKPLLEVNGKPLIAYHLERLTQAGIQRVVINVAWLGKKIIEAIGDGSQFNLQIHYSDEGAQALETAGGIIKALPELEEQFIVINADVYTDIDIHSLQCGDALAHLKLVQNPDFHPKGDFGIRQGYLLAQSSEQYTFSGVACYKKLFFSGLEHGKRALAPIIRKHAQDKRVRASLHKGYWSDVGTPERLVALQIR